MHALANEGTRVRRRVAVAYRLATFGLRGVGLLARLSPYFILAVEAGDGVGLLARPSALLLRVETGTYDYPILRWICLACTSPG